MKFENLNTYCVEVLFNSLPESDVWRIAQLFPEHQEAANAVLKGKQEINIDDVSNRGAEPFLQALKQCCNVKKLTCSRFRVDNALKGVPEIVAQYCPLVEELNIPALYIENYNTLNKLTNLRKVNFATCVNIMEHPCATNFFKNNPQLIDVTLKRYYDEDSFDELPKSIQKFKLVANLGTIDTLMSTITTWNLQTLILLQVNLETRDIETLYTQKQLVCLHLEYFANNADLIPMFVNNPRLESISLNQYDSPTRDDYTFLQELPKSVRKLRIRGIFKPGPELIEYLKTSNLDELFFCISKHLSFPEFVAAATNLTVLGLDCSTRTPYLNRIKQLTKLKYLKLMGLRLENGDALKEILQSCVNLEKVHLNRHYERPMDIEDGVTPLALYYLKNLYMTNYHEVVSCLETNQILSSVSIIGCEEVNGQNLANLVRNCKSLKEIIYKGIYNVFDLVLQVSAALDEQQDRESVLNLVFHNEDELVQAIADFPCNPLLKISICEFLEANGKIYLF